MADELDKKPEGPFIKALDPNSIGLSSLRKTIVGGQIANNQEINPPTNPLFHVIPGRRIALDADGNEIPIMIS